MTRFALAAVLASCGQASAPGTYDRAALVLRDVQGLFGGHDVWIAADGTLAARTVRVPRAGESGLQEARYAGRLSESELEELRALLAANDPLTIRTKDRPGVPDEARPTLTVRLPTGESATVSKWANDRHARFDAVYGWLLKKATALEKDPPRWSGRHEPSWRPDGFRD